MAYIGKQPQIGNYIKLDAITTSATTTFNLTAGGVAVYPQTATNCIVSLNGVIQAPTDAYTISGSTIVFASALTTSDVIDFITVLGDVLNIGTPSDGTISTAKLATGLVVPYGKGGTGLTTLGTANQVLAVNSGATALEFQSVSSDFVLLATATASSTSTISFDGYFSSTYKNYKLIASNFVPSSASQLMIRFRRSNADVTSANYVWVYTAGRVSDSNVGAQDYANGYNDTSINISGTESLSSNWNGNAEITIYDPLSTDNFKNVTYNFGFTYTNPTVYYYSGAGGGQLKDSASALSGISFFTGGYNFSKGTYKLYGIK